MSTEADILTILNGLSNINSYIKNFEKDFNKLRINETPELAKTLQQAKSLVDDFYTHASNIKELFYTKCVLLSTSDIDSAVDNSINIENIFNKDSSFLNSVQKPKPQNRKNNLQSEEHKLTSGDKYSENINSVISISDDELVDEQQKSNECFNDVFAMIDNDLTEEEENSEELPNIPNYNMDTVSETSNTTYINETDPDELNETINFDESNAKAAENSICNNSEISQNECQAEQTPSNEDAANHSKPQNDEIENKEQLPDQIRSETEAINTNIPNDPIEASQQNDADKSEQEAIKELDNITEEEAKRSSTETVSDSVQASVQANQEQSEKTETQGIGDVINDIDRLTDDTEVNSRRVDTEGEKLNSCENLTGVQDNSELEDDQIALQEETDDHSVIEMQSIDKSNDYEDIESDNKTEGGTNTMGDTDAKHKETYGQAVTELQKESSDDKEDMLDNVTSNSTIEEIEKQPDIHSNNTDMEVVEQEETCDKKLMILEGNKDLDTAEKTEDTRNYLLQDNSESTNENIEAANESDIKSNNTHLEVAEGETGDQSVQENEDSGTAETSDDLTVRNDLLKDTIGSTNEDTEVTDTLKDGSGIKRNITDMEVAEKEETEIIQERNEKDSSNIETETLKNDSEKKPDDVVDRNDLSEDNFHFTNENTLKDDAGMKNNSNTGMETSEEEKTDDQPEIIQKELQGVEENEDKDTTKKSDDVDITNDSLEDNPHSTNENILKDDAAIKSDHADMEVAEEKTDDQPENRDTTKKSDDVNVRNDLLEYNPLSTSENTLKDDAGIKSNSNADMEIPEEEKTDDQPEIIQKELQSVEENEDRDTAKKSDDVDVTNDLLEDNPHSTNENILKDNSDIKSNSNADMEISEEKTEGKTVQENDDPSTAEKSDDLNVRNDLLKDTIDSTNEDTELTDTLKDDSGIKRNITDMEVAENEGTDDQPEIIQEGNENDSSNIETEETETLKNDSANKSDDVVNRNDLSEDNFHSTNKNTLKEDASIKCNNADMEVAEEKPMGDHPEIIREETTNKSADTETTDTLKDDSDININTDMEVAEEMYDEPETIQDREEDIAETIPVKDSSIIKNNETSIETRDAEPAKILDNSSNETQSDEHLDTAAKSDLVEDNVQIPVNSTQEKIDTVKDVENEMDIREDKELNSCSEIVQEKTDIEEQSKCENQDSVEVANEPMETLEKGESDQSSNTTSAIVDVPILASNKTDADIAEQEKSNTEMQAEDSVSAEDISTSKETEQEEGIKNNTEAKLVEGDKLGNEGAQNNSEDKDSSTPDDSTKTSEPNSAQRIENEKLRLDCARDANSPDLFHFFRVQDIDDLFELNNVVEKSVIDAVHLRDDSEADTQCEKQKEESKSAESDCGPDRESQSETIEEANKQTESPVSTNIAVESQCKNSNTDVIDISDDELDEQIKTKEDSNIAPLVTASKDRPTERALDNSENAENSQTILPNETSNIERNRSEQPSSQLYNVNTESQKETNEQTEPAVGGQTENSDKDNVIDISDDELDEQIKTREHGNNTFQSEAVRKSYEKAAQLSLEINLNRILDIRKTVFIQENENRHLDAIMNSCAPGCASNTIEISDDELQNEDLQQNNSSKSVNENDKNYVEDLQQNNSSMSVNEKDQNIVEDLQQNNSSKSVIEKDQNIVEDLQQNNSSKSVIEKDQNIVEDLQQNNSSKSVIEKDQNIVEDLQQNNSSKSVIEKDQNDVEDLQQNNSSKSVNENDKNDVEDLQQNSSSKSNNNENDKNVTEEIAAPNITCPQTELNNASCVVPNLPESFNETETNKEIAPEIKTEDTYRPKIKLVDLNKLIDHNRKNAFKIDKAVIVLSSSDEESEVSKKHSGKSKKRKRKKRSMDRSDSGRKKKFKKERTKEKKQKKTSGASKDQEKNKSLNIYQTVEIKVYKDYTEVIPHKRHKTSHNIQTTSSQENQTVSTITNSTVSTSTDRQINQKLVVNCANMKRLFFTKQLNGEYLDKKLRSKVYVPLSRINCEKLKEPLNNKTNER